MAPYKALYGKKCRSPVWWYEVGERRLMDPELIQTTSDLIKVIRNKLQIVQSRPKNYTDKRRRNLEFSMDDNVFLKVSLTKGIFRFEKKRKMSPKFIWPFKILKTIRAVAY
jgi:hypothetical protein